MLFPKLNLSFLDYTFCFAVFLMNFGAFVFGLPLRFRGFWHEITRRLLAEAQNFACYSITVRFCAIRSSISTCGSQRNTIGKYAGLYTRIDLLD